MRTPTISTYLHPSGRYYATLSVPGGVSWRCEDLRATRAKARADGRRLRAVVGRAREGKPQGVRP